VHGKSTIFIGKLSKDERLLSLPNLSNLSTATAD